MPKVMKTCRVCGRPYEACRTATNTIGVFRWQDVACSPECGSVYLQKLNESRGVSVKESETKQTSISVPEPTIEPVKRASRKKKTQNTGVTPLRLETDSHSTNNI